MIRRLEPHARLSAAVVHGGITWVSGQVPETVNATVGPQAHDPAEKA